MTGKDARVERLINWLCEVRPLYTEPVDAPRKHAISLLMDALLFTDPLSDYQIQVAYNLFALIVAPTIFKAGARSTVRDSLRWNEFHINPKSKGESHA